METIRVGDAKARFSELLSRVAAGERFLIQRREHPVAVLISAGDLERLDRTARLVQRLALALGQNEDLLAQIERGEVHPAMAAFGLWRDEPDLATLADTVLRTREEQAPRTGVDL